MFPAQAEPPFNGGNSLLNLLNVIMVLAVIIVLILVLIRFLGRRNQTLMSGRSMRTLGAVGLGPNKSMQVIEMGSSLYVIGVGENVTMLDKISDPEEVAFILSAMDEQSVSSGNMLAPLISKLKGRLRGQAPSEELDVEENSAFYDVLQTKLRSAPDRKEKIEALREEVTRDQSRDI